MNRAIIDSGAGIGSLKSYAIGFILSVLLTAFAFGIALSGGVPRWIVLIAVFGSGIAQIMVHLHYFLHLDTSSSMRWNILALLLTLLIMALFVGGTLWIMYQLNYRLM
jgi:cytochrome o ubiquinol oxidase subunit IV